MTKLLTAAQMRGIEQAAIASGAVSGPDLMERAGQGVVEAIFEAWPELLDQRGASPPNLTEYLSQKEVMRRAVVFCGPGNNGGDGFVVARLLAARGWAVDLYLYGDAARLPPDAKANFERWARVGEVRALSDGVSQDVSADLLVDAVFGTGITRPLPATVVSALDGLGRYARIVAVDMPSGLDSDSGKAIGGHRAAADLTVSFHRAKNGHFLAEGPAACGRLVVKDIGLAGQGVGDAVGLIERSDVSGHLPKAVGHKYAHGHALILSGPSGKGGAARLAARGALRIGAGLVTLGCPPEALAENAARLDAVMLAALHDGDALARVLADGRINALCLGPGLGLARARELVPVALATGRRCVLDADGLSTFADDPGGLFQLLHGDVVLTPHSGEFARLFPDIAIRLDDAPMSGPAFSKVDAAHAAAARAGCVVLLKGPDTVIAAPDGRCSVNSAAYERAAPWLATAGSGDVLAGFITGLLARGVPVMQAAEAAAWMHVECALGFGPGLIAEDLADELPGVFRNLGL